MILEKPFYCSDLEDLKVQRETVDERDRETRGSREDLGEDVSGLYLPSPPAADLCPRVQIEEVRETPGLRLLTAKNTQEPVSRLASLRQSLFCDGIIGVWI